MTDKNEEKKLGVQKIEQENTQQAEQQFIEISDDEVRKQTKLFCENYKIAEYFSSSTEPYYRIIRST